MKQLPDWAVWQQKAYGTTYEPVVFIYNKRLIPQNEVPDSHTALAKLDRQPGWINLKARSPPTTSKNRASAYALAVQDSQADANYFTDLANIAKGGLTVQSSTGTMMEARLSGENLIGYNILGSYAEARAKNDPSLGIAYPKDYVLVLSASRLISQESEHPNAAKLWLD
ncbi:extracellular solute-binding protein [Klebsiella pneumoniae subsp. pneumoniae]|nr:extracellular solute-binding protein [Klebsiella pneumoniae subsp. pneumoniae]